MRASRAAVACAVAAAVASGCGGGGGGDGGEAAPAPDAVRSAVTGFARAFAAGDGRRSCARLTPAAQAAFLKRVRKLAPAGDCATAIARLHDAAGSQVTQAFATAAVGAVEVAGTTATARLTASGHATTVRLVKQGGDWKLAAVPGT